MEDRKQQLKEVLNDLIREYGVSETEAAIRVLLGVKDLRLSAPDYNQCLTPERIFDTLNQCDAGNNDTLKIGKDLPELLKRQGALKGEINVIEANAFNTCETNGKNIVVKVNGGNLELSNKEARDLWVDSLGANKKKELAEVTGEIEAVKAEQSRIESVNQNIRSKADLQSSLLRFLAGR